MADLGSKGRLCSFQGALLPAGRAIFLSLPLWCIQPIFIPHFCTFFDSIPCKFSSSACLMHSHVFFFIVCTFLPTGSVNFFSPCMFDVFNQFLLFLLLLFFFSLILHYLMQSTKNPSCPHQLAFWPSLKVLKIYICLQSVKNGLQVKCRECLKFVKRTHGGNVFEQMMGKGGRKQKWSSNKIAAEKAAKIDKKRGRDWQEA